MTREYDVSPFTLLNHPNYRVAKVTVYPKTNMFVNSKNGKVKELIRGKGYLGIMIHTDMVGGCLHFWLFQFVNELGQLCNYHEEKGFTKVLGHREFIIDELLN